MKYNVKSLALWEIKVGTFYKQRQLSPIIAPTQFVSFYTSLLHVTYIDLKLKMTFLHVHVQAFCSSFWKNPTFLNLENITYRGYIFTAQSYGYQGA